MRINHANSRRHALRLIGMSAGVAAALILMMVFAGRADAAADLSVSKTDSPDPVVQGNNLTYTIQVSNAGPDTAMNVVLTDTLPGQVDFVSATASTGTCIRTGDTVACTLGNIAVAGSATVTIVIQPKKAGTITNTAVATSPDDPSGASASAQTTVQSKGQAKAPKGRPSCAAPTISGTAGDDVITGTDRADVIVTFAGNDQVFALGGKDLVCTGAGFDLVLGGFGGDTIIGGVDSDRLVGNAGGDLLKGKAGNDRLRGKAGNDVLNGGSQRDSCKGGKGADVLKRCP
jgi:uncharacterized repeat protein (TIGR01451 family)